MIVFGATRRHFPDWCFESRGPGSSLSCCIKKGDLNTHHPQILLIRSGVLPLSAPSREAPIGLEETTGSGGEIGDPGGARSAPRGGGPQFEYLSGGRHLKKRKLQGLGWLRETAASVRSGIPEGRDLRREGKHPTSNIFLEGDF